MPAAWYNKDDRIFGTPKNTQISFLISKKCEFRLRNFLEKKTNFLKNTKMKKENNKKQ